MQFSDSFLDGARAHFVVDTGTSLADMQRIGSLMIWPPGLEKKSRPPLAGRAADRFKGVQDINGNPVKAQGPKRKRRTPIIRQLRREGYTQFTILELPDGSTKTYVGDRAVTAVNDDEPNPWHK